MPKRNVPRAFVSSTFLDLRETRRLVADQLVGMDILPVGMEVFPASGTGPWKIIQNAIDDADFYILVVAGRYGSLCPDVVAGRSGVSWTEAEYEYARRQGKPIIAILHANPNKLPRDLVDDAGSEVWRFRERLDDELLTTRYADEAELIAGLYRSISYSLRTGLAASRSGTAVALDLDQFLERSFDRCYELLAADWSFSLSRTGDAWDAKYSSKRMVRAQWTEGLALVTLDHTRPSDKHKSFDANNPPIVEPIDYDRTEAGCAELVEPPRRISPSNFVQDVRFDPPLRKGEVCTLDVRIQFPNNKFAYREDLREATRGEPGGERTYDMSSFKINYPTDRLVLSCFLLDALGAESAGVGVRKGRIHSDPDEIDRIQQLGYFQVTTSRSGAGEPGTLLMLDVPNPVYGRTYQIRWRPPCRV